MVVAGTHYSPSVDGWGRERHFVSGYVSVVGVVTVELATTVTHGIWSILNGEPVGVVCTAVTLVPVEAVITTEGDKGVGDRYCSTEELDAVVQVRDDLYVIDGGARTDTTEGDSVDLVGCSELGTAVAQ